MRFHARLLTVGALVACTVFAQDAPAFRSNLDLAVIPCAVVDAAGSPVFGLRRDDFRAFDNGVPRILSYFSQDDDQPVTLGVLIDDSDSQHELRTEHRR